MQNKKYIYILLLIISTIVFIMLGFAVYEYSFVNGNRLFLDSSNLKYYILVIMVVLSLVMILYIKLSRNVVKNRKDASYIYKFSGLDKNEKKYKEKIIQQQPISSNKSKRKIIKKDIPVDKENVITNEYYNSNPVEDNTKLNKEATLLNKEDDLKSSEIAEEPIEVNTTDTRFYMLNQIDLEYEDKEKELFKDNISLEEICNDFRNFSAGRLKLYYDISDIRRFIAGLSVTKLLILQGMSGTGKTSLAYAFGEFLDNKAVVVPIQPMWKERTDLIGYYNEFTRKFNETTLLYKMYEANYNPQIYITVLDEMNIARVEYYFAEFLSLLELPNPDGRNLDVVSDVWPTDPKLLNKGKLRLPTNMWFIGTANNDDSTFAISDKVYDRAMVINLDTKAEVFEAEAIEPKRITSEFLQVKFDEAIKEYKLSQRNLRRLQMLDKYLIDKFHITFGNRIMKQIQIYAPVMVACGGSELDALDDIISRKILRKLESKNPVYVKSQSEALCNYIDEVFGVDKMPLCKNAIYTIEQNS